MENASKALIIAGAILLAILLISLGIMIYNQAQGVASGTGMTDAQIQTFNTDLQKFEGENVTGTQVRALMNQIIAINSDNDTTNDLTSVTGSGISGFNKNTTSWVNASAKYSVVFGYNTGEGKTGRINSVKITKK